MRRLGSFETYEEAYNKALEILLHKGEENNPLRGKIQVCSLSKKYEGGGLIDTGLENNLEEVGIVTRLHESRDYHAYIFDRGEYGRFTYIFRNLQFDKVFVALCLSRYFVKPTIEISPDEAASQKGGKVIGDFFNFEGENYFKDPTAEEISSFTAEDAFTYFEEDEEEGIGGFLQLNCSPPPYVLSEATGKQVKSLDSYKKALSKLLSCEFSKQQQEAIESSYNFYQGDRLLKYALYEFMRTEKYSDLQKALSHYSKFGLPKQWEENLPYLCDWKRGDRRITAEEYVLSKYLSKDAADLIGGYTFQEVADYTGTPLSLIIKASKIKVWE